MKDAMKSWISGNARNAAEDMAGIVALFVVLFAVLSMPGLA